MIKVAARASGPLAAADESPQLNSLLGINEVVAGIPTNPGSPGQESSALLAKFQLLGNRLVATGIRRVQVFQQTAALANHHEQATA